MTLAQAWHTEFRSALDILPTASWESDEQGSVWNSAFAEHESVVTDFSISIPFAAYEAFMAMTQQLSDPRQLGPILRLLFRLLPFVKLHLRTCDMDAAGTEILMRPMATVIDVLDRFSQASPDAQSVYMRERVVAFAIDVFFALSPLSSTLEVLRDEFFGRLLATTNTNGVPSTVAGAMLLKSASPSGINLLLAFLRDGREWVRLSVLGILEETWEAYSERVLSHPILVRALIEGLAKCSPETIQFRNRGYALLSAITNDPRADEKFLSQILISTQMLFDLDNGKVMEAVLRSIQNIDRSTLAAFCLREKAAEVLASMFATELHGDELHIPTADCLVIPPSLIVMLSEWAPPSSRMDDKDFTVELFARALQQEPKDRSSFTNHLRALMPAVVDEEVQRQAQQLAMPSLLLDEFCGGFAWTKSAAALPRLLSVLRIFVEKDAAFLHQLRANPLIFPRFAEYIFNPDAQVRYELGRIIGSVLLADAAMPAQLRFLYHMYGKGPTPATQMQYAPSEVDWIDVLKGVKKFYCVRILVVPPANADDVELLSRVLAFVHYTLEWRIDLMHVQEWLIPSFQRVILPCLRNATPTSGNLESHVLRFAVEVFRRVPQDLQLRLVSQMDCFAVVISWIQHWQWEASPQNICNALELLTGILALPAQLSAKNLEHAAGILISFVASVQRLRAAGESHYHQRGLYSRSVFCLRLIASKSSDAVPWLLHDSLAWLMTLLNDETDIQKSALGIVASFVKADAFRKVLEAVLPNYINLAVEIFADPAADCRLRKEAIVIINNFLLVASNRHDATSEIDQAFSQLAEMGFFKALPEAFTAITTYFPFHNCLSQALLTIARMGPERLGQTLSDLNLWKTLVRLLSLQESSPDPTELYQQLANRQAAERPYPLTAWPTCAALLETFWIMLHQDPGLQLYVVQETTLLEHAVNILDLCAARTELDFSFSDDVLDRVLEPSIRVLSEVLLTCATNQPSTLRDRFQLGSTGHNVFKVLLSSLKGPKQLARTACQLLARLFALHYGGTVDLGIDSVLETRLFKNGDTAMIAVGLHDVLAHVLLKDYDIQDAPYMEAARLSLQALLGCNEGAKQRAFQGGFLPKLLQRARGLSGSLVWSQRQQHDLLLILTMWRHAMAGSQMLKVYAGKAKIIVIFLEILAREECVEDLLLETLQTVNNFIGNCRETKRLMFEPVVARAPQSTTLTLAILSIARKKNASVPLFQASFDVFKGLALDPEARHMMSKAGVVASICSILDHLTKAKDSAKSPPVLEFFTNFTCSRDGQLTVMQTEGAFDLFKSLARCQKPTEKAAALRVLCNLAVPKETKPRFILDEEFIAILHGLLAINEPDISKLTAALLKALVHQSEKSKVALKNEGIIVEKRNEMDPKNFIRLKGADSTGRIGSRGYRA
ncbi:hypothetical protein HDU86_000143 [Geranomyces michiganensis]|nr:hypothetical protein HDU86_000143 [Geranomyces michiganensis]